MKEEKGFFATLFDISFDEFITTKIIKFLYVLSMVIIGIGALYGIGAAFHSSVWMGFLTLLVFAPLGFLLFLICVRIWLELIIVIFKIADNTSIIASQNKPGNDK